jgi:hypothetical protein
MGEIMERNQMLIERKIKEARFDEDELSSDEEDEKRNNFE